MAQRSDDPALGDLHAGFDFSIVTRFSWACWQHAHAFVRRHLLGGGIQVWLVAAASTFNHYRSLLSLSCRLGILNGKVSSNPARSVTHRREDNNRVRFLTEEEEEKFRKVIEPKWPFHIAELHLAINTGLRKGSRTA